MKPHEFKMSDDDVVNKLFHDAINQMEEQRIDQGKPPLTQADYKRLADEIERAVAKGKQQLGNDPRAVASASVVQKDEVQWVAGKLNLQMPLNEFDIMALAQITKDAVMMAEKGHSDFSAGLLAAFTFMYTRPFKIHKERVEDLLKQKPNVHHYDKGTMLDMIYTMVEEKLGVKIVSKDDDVTNTLITTAMSFMEQYMISMSETATKGIYEGINKFSKHSIKDIDELLKSYMRYGSEE